MVVQVRSSNAPSPTRQPSLATFVLVPTLYLLGAMLGSYLTLTPDGVALIWPANAILLAALVRHSGRGAVGFALGGLVAEVLADLHLFTPAKALFFGLSNLVEVCVAWLLLDRWGFNPRFQRVTDVGRFVLAAPFAGALVAALIGTLLLPTVGEKLPGFLDTLSTWWLGDATGLLLFTPLYLSFWYPSTQRPTFQASARLDVGMALGGLLLFGMMLAARGGVVFGMHARPLLMLPFLAYAAVRLPLRALCVVVSAVSLAFVGLAVAGRNPYGPAPPAVEAVWAQEYVLVISVVALGLSSLLTAIQYEQARTQRTNLELRAKTLALEQSNEELRRIAFVAAHDLQTPLRTICSFSQLLGREFRGRTDARVEDWVRRIAESTTRLEHLLRDLGTLAAIDAQTGPRETVDMNQVYAEVHASIEGHVRSAGGTLTADPLPVVRGERDLLARLLKELVCNALQFRGSAPPEVHVSAQRDATAWVFSVHDNGAGIPADQQERIFDLFYRPPDSRAEAGTGFGLALCTRIVHRHCGRIWVVSAPGQGSTFFFSLPQERTP